jgi:hypothetical protein
MTEAQARAKTVNVFTSWTGLKESNGGHKKIIDIYNAHLPLARGYKVKYTDSWCATTYSAAAIVAGYTDIIPLECSCAKMIELFQKMGRWVEDDKYVPSPGDAIFYDWDDDANYASTDDKGSPEHIGMCVDVTDNVIMVIEGNKSDAVGYRSVPVNGKYIRGFGIPDFAKKATVKEAVKSLAEIAQEVVAGKWGTGDIRKARLKAAGYDADVIQVKVNEILQSNSSSISKTKKSNKEIANEVIAGKWGDGTDRTKKLKAAGYDTAAIQKIINQLLKK